MIAERPIAAIEQVDGLQGALDGKEASLGNPASSGLVLASTTAGVRSWAAPVDQAHRAASSDAHPIGAVTGLADALADGRSEVLSSVTVLSTDHPATWTADAATDVLTSSAAHGLVVGEAIAFGAGTGALPGGLSPEPEFYHVIAVPTTTTLQVSLTYGGAAVDITDAGTAGWVVRKLPAAFQVLDGLSLEEAGTIDFYIDSRWTRIKGLAPYPIVRTQINPTRGRIYANSDIGTGLWYAGFVGATYAKKYSRSLTVLRLQKLSTGLATFTFANTGITSGVSAFTSDATVVSFCGGGFVEYDDDITAFGIYDGRQGRLESGSTAIAVRRP